MTVSFLTHEHAQRKDNRKSVLHKDIMKYELHKKTIYLEVSISFLGVFMIRSGVLDGVSFRDNVPGKG